MVKSHNAKKPIRLNETPEGLEVTRPEEVSIDGQIVSPIDPNFHTELNYEGYEEIDEYDNTLLNSDITKRSRVIKELKLKDRESQNENAEENPIDPQENLTQFNEIK